jgi:FkbM family methyltransferase
VVNISSREILNTIEYIDKFGNTINVPNNMVNFLSAGKKETPLALFNLIKDNPLRIFGAIRYILGTSSIKLMPKVERHDLIKSFLPVLNSLETMKLYGKNGIDYLLYVGGNLFLMEMNYVCYEQILYGEGYTKSYDDLKEKIVVDAGANIGGFSIFAAKNGAKKVYAFEPIMGSVEIIKKNAILNGCEKIIEIIPFALGDKNEKAKIVTTGAGDVCASMVFTRPGVGTTDIEIKTLDSYDIKIGVLKMDVEGYENNILKGGKKILTKNKPLMVICAYHKPDDMIVLPKTVLEIDKNYNIIVTEDGGEKKIRCEIK